MMEMKHPNTGLSLFRTIKVGLACDACIAAGKPEKCTHQSSLVPEWKSSSKHSMIKALYDMAGKGEMMQVRLRSCCTGCCAVLTLACAFFAGALLFCPLQRESMGLVTENQSSCFDVAMIEAAFNEPFDMAPFFTRTRWLFCCVDPTGGGRSCLAAVTVAFVENRMIVVDVANTTARGHTAIKTVLGEHFDRVRQMGFTATPIVVVVENNLGQEAEHIAHMFKHSDGSLLHFMREDGIAGCRTTQKRKELFTGELTKYIQLGGFKMARQFLDTEHCDAQLQEEIKRQLVCWRRVVLVSTSGRSEPRILYTGKDSGNDDVTIVLSMVAFYGTQFAQGNMAIKISDVVTL